MWPRVLSLFFVFYGSGVHRDLHSFPTRRSSDLTNASALLANSSSVTSSLYSLSCHTTFILAVAAVDNLRRQRSDRKSTRLNSSHGYISYAVFCLKKKNAPHPLAAPVRSLPLSCS